MGMIKKILALLNSDSSDEGTSNSLTVLIRYISVLIITYYFVLGVIFLIKGFGLYGIILLASALVLVMTVTASFYINAHAVLALLALSLTASSAYLTRSLGWRCSFQNMIYLVIMIIWYDSSLSNRLKALFSTVLVTAICVIDAVTPFGGTVFDPDSLGFKFLVFVNISVFSSALSCIAYFYCRKFVDAEHKLYLYNKKLKKMAESDPLTKLMNRRCITDTLDEIEKNYKQNNNSVSVAIGDIDFFKHVNDTYGHDCGDYVLQTIAGFFTQFMEGKGEVARWGGEEFLFVFNDMNGDDAFIKLNDLRTRISEYDFEFNGKKLRVNMTFGLEEYSSRDGYEEAIKKADNKLYLGKESGRNKVVY